MAFLIDDLILAPAKFTKWVAESLQTAALEEMDQEEQGIRDDFLDLELQRETAGVSEEDLAEKEDELLRRLDAARKERRGASADSLP